MQNSPSYLGSDHNTEFLKSYTYKYHTPGRHVGLSTERESFSFVKRYGGGYWFATTPVWDINGNPPCSTPITFSLVGMLADVTFCDTSDILQMREVNGTAVLRTFDIGYRQLTKGSGYIHSNLWRANAVARNSELPGDVVSREGCAILSFGSLQKVSLMVHPSTASANPCHGFRETSARSLHSATVPHRIYWTNHTKSAWTARFTSPDVQFSAQSGAAYRTRASTGSLAPTPYTTAMETSSHRQVTQLWFRTLWQKLR